MNIGELKKNLSEQSLEKIRETIGEIKSMLEIRDRLKEILYNPKLNYWEEAVKILDDSSFCQKKNKDKYITFCLLYVDIRRNGLKFPISIQRKRDDGLPLNKWIILNGHHRMAIADILELEDMPIKFIDAKDED
jgi:hypothetical protein